MVITVISVRGDFGPNHLSPKKLWRRLGQISAKLSCGASSKKVDIADIADIGTRNCTSLTHAYQQYKGRIQGCIQSKATNTKTQKSNNPRLPARLAVWGTILKWSISSHIRVQITRESVRLIALIGLNMFLIHNISRKCLKKFSRTGF